MIDDVGWADFGYSNNIATRYGSKENSNGQIPTPNIDKLANKGLKFTSHYVHPTCTPSRYAMIIFYLNRVNFGRVISLPLNMY